MLKIGTVIDEKYKIINIIGHGGMSTVYLAIHEKVNKLWAIKEIRKDSSQDYAIVRRSLLTEMELLKKMKYSHLPSIVDIIDYDDNFLIVMDYVEGVTLDKVIREVGPQKQDDVVKWAIQLCDVLTYLHNRKPPSIYRDMKPSNIMLQQDGNVVLIDFGTAREFKGTSIEDTVCLGTRGYAAPEQFGNMGQTDARTDIYCLGVTMYQMLTGHNPSEPPYEMYPIRYWNSTLSSGLERIIYKCIQQNPDKRYQTAEELMDDLKQYKELDSPMIKKYKKKIALFATTLILTLGCGITTIAFWITGHDAKRQQYEYWMEQADRVKDRDGKTEAYLNAIHTDPTQTEAYQELIDYFIEEEMK